MTLTLLGAVGVTHAARVRVLRTRGDGGDAAGDEGGELIVGDVVRAAAARLLGREDAASTLLVLLGPIDAMPATTPSSICCTSPGSALADGGVKAAHAVLDLELVLVDSVETMSAKCVSLEISWSVPRRSLRRRSWSLLLRDAELLHGDARIGVEAVDVLLGGD